MKKVIYVLKKTESTYQGGVVSILNHYFENKEVFEKQGYEIVLFNYALPSWTKKLPSTVQNIVYGFFQARALSRKLKSEANAIVHIHTSREFLFLKDIAVARRIYKRNHSKIAMTIHVGACDTVFNRIKFFEKWCVKMMNTCLEKVIFLSNVMQKEFQEKGLSPDIAELLYNFHALEDLEESEQGKSEKEHLELLFVGAIHREKGILELLNAINSMENSNLHLNICGTLTDSSIKNDFESLLHTLGDRVSLCGYVSGKEKTRIFNQADVLILPSYHEGFPLVVLEALASKCALVCTPVGSTTEVLTESNVIWVSIKNTEDIKNAIEVLDQDRERLYRMKCDNYLLSQEFTKEKHIIDTCTIYNTMLDQ